MAVKIKLAIVFCLLTFLSASSAYTQIELSQFDSTAALQINSNAALVDSKLRLTASVQWQDGTCWHTTKQILDEGFTTEFLFDITGDNLIEIGLKSFVYGSIVAPDAKVNIDDGLLFKGAICAETIEVGMGGRFLHHSFGSTTKPIVAVGKNNQSWSVLEAEFERELQLHYSQPPATFILHQNYPNPFNPSTAFRYQLPVNSDVELAIYNVQGQLVRRLVAGQQPAGSHSALWDGTGDRGQRVPSGVYVYRLRAGSFVQTRKLLLLK